MVSVASRNSQDNRIALREPSSHTRFSCSVQAGRQPGKSPGMVGFWCLRSTASGLCRVCYDFPAFGRILTRDSGVCNVGCFSFDH